jgi:hypothetical protein
MTAQSDELAEVPIPRRAASGTAAPAQHASRARPGPRWLTNALAHRWLLAAIAVGVVVPVILAAATGSLSIPHNDGWSYSKIAQVFARTGHIRLLGWNRSPLMGQFVILGPLAAHVSVQQLSVAAFAAVALVSVYDLLRPSIGLRNAGITTFVLALWPGFGLMSTSFMTDVPSLAAMFLCLALGRRALERDSVLLFALSLLSGFWGTTIRDQSLAAPAVVVLYALWTFRSRTKLKLWIVLAGAAVFGVAYEAFNAWFTALPNNDPPTYQLVPGLMDTTTSSILRSYFTIALVAAPGVFWMARPMRWRLSARLTALGTAVAALMLLHDNHTDTFFPGGSGNTGVYLAPSGSYAGTVIDGYSRVVLSNPVWWTLIVLAIVSGALLAGLLVHKALGSDRLVGTFALVYSAGTLWALLEGQRLFDRYSLPLLPCLLAIALRPEPATAATAAPVAAPGRPRGLPVAGTERLSGLIRGTAGAVAGVAVGVLAFALMTSALIGDAQRWKLDTRLTAEGTPAMRVDGGLEWVGWHASQCVTNRYPPPEDKPEGFFTSVQPCYVVTAVAETGKLAPGWQLSQTVEYRQFLVAGTTRLWVYATHASGCRY